MPTYVRYDNNVQSALGSAVPGALIAVLTQPANTSTYPGTPLATIYSDSTGTPLANPFQANGQNGEYFFYAATGLYTVQVYGSAPTQPFPASYPDQTLATQGGGSVTSVSLTVPSWLTVAGSPVTSSGTLAVTGTTGQPANSFVATPFNATGAVSLRTLTPQDLTTAVFIGSGATHSAGAVPDPGATPGTTRFLREDATWVAFSTSTPPGGADTQVQVNSGGSFYGDSGLTYQRITGLLTVAASVNAVVGFQQNGTAASGNVLRGNGTNFVSSVLNFTDLGGVLQLTQTPLTTLGDILYVSNAVGSPPGLGLARLPGNITSTKEYLSQTGTGSVSAAPAWAQIAAADLSNGVTGSGAVVLATAPTVSALAITGKVTSYNGFATAGTGIPSIVASVSLTSQTAAIGSTQLFTTGASGAGQYRVTWNAKITTSDAGSPPSSTLGPFGIVYTDPDGVTITLTASAQNAAGTSENTDTGNTTSTVLLGRSLMLNCKANTAINYTMGYASSAANMAYNLHVKLEAI